MAVAPFLPTAQRNLLIHGELTPDFVDVPPNIQVVTFMETGQALVVESAHDLIFWLANASRYLMGKDLKPLTAQKFDLDGRTIRMRVYNHGDNFPCPNFNFHWVDPYLPALGFYNTSKGEFTFEKFKNPPEFRYSGKDAALTNHYVQTLGLVPGSLTNLEATLQYLYQVLTPGHHLRLFILACSDIAPGAPQPQILNMNEDEPEGGWPDFVNMIHSGGKRRRRRTRGRHKQKKTRRQSHPKK